MPFLPMHSAAGQYFQNSLSHHPAEMLGESSSTAEGGEVVPISNPTTISILDHQTDICGAGCLSGRSPSTKEVMANLEDGEDETLSPELEQQLRQKLGLDSSEDVAIFNPASLPFSLWIRSEPKLNAWFPERGSFWENEGKAISLRNVYVSQVNLMFAFAVWLMWSVIAVRIQVAHDLDSSKYAFGMTNTDKRKYQGMLYLLPCLAGISGACFRIINAFIILPVGGRLTTTLTSVLLVVPCVLAAWELKMPHPNFLNLAVAAMLSGIGGGAFSSSMSNICHYCPARRQGAVLGLNAGLGNLGVSVSQWVIPLVTQGAVCGAAANCQNFEELWMGALIWAPACVAAAVAAHRWLTDMPHHGNAPVAHRLYYYICLQAGATAASAVTGVTYLFSNEFFSSSPTSMIGLVFLVVLVACFSSHLMLFVAAPWSILGQIKSSMVFFKNPHTYIMTWMYMVCFGTYIGFSTAFPKLVQDIFGYVGGDENLVANPRAPNWALYSFIGPFLGSIVRPLGGWLSDKFTGAVVTQVVVGCLCGSAFGVGVVVQQAQNSEHPEAYFDVFLCLFLLLFTSSGIANGSTFKQMSQIIRDQGQVELVGPVLGWSAAMGSLGAFIVPSVLAVATTNSGIAKYMFGFGVFYLICFVLNFWFYVRPEGKGGSWDIVCSAAPCAPIRQFTCPVCGGLHRSDGHRGGEHGAHYCTCHLIILPDALGDEEDEASSFPQRGAGTETPLTVGAKAHINGWLARAACTRNEGAARGNELSRVPTNMTAQSLASLRGLDVEDSVSQRCATDSHTCSNVDHVVAPYGLIHLLMSGAGSSDGGQGDVKAAMMTSAHEAHEALQLKQDPVTGVNFYTDAHDDALLQEHQALSARFSGYKPSACGDQTGVRERGSATHVLEEGNQPPAGVSRGDGKRLAMCQNLLRYLGSETAVADAGERQRSDAGERQRSRGVLRESLHEPAPGSRLMPEQALKLDLETGQEADDKRANGAEYDLVDALCSHFSHTS